VISSIGAAGSALSPTFVGWMKMSTGSLFGAIDALALFFALSLIALNFCLPARKTEGFAGRELRRSR
jgi:nitrate/nitrite transporter NarK